MVGTDAYVGESAYVDEAFLSSLSLSGVGDLSLVCYIVSVCAARPSLHRFRGGRWTSRLDSKPCFVDTERLIIHPPVDEHLLVSGTENRSGISNSLRDWVWSEIPNDVGWFWYPSLFLNLVNHFAALAAMFRPSLLQFSSATSCALNLPC